MVNDRDGQDDVLVVGGRRFAPPPGYSFLRHQYIQGQLAFIGASDILAARQDDPQRAFLELNLVIGESGRSGAILAGFVTEVELGDAGALVDREVGRPWEHGAAGANAAFFAGDHELPDYLLMQDAIQQRILDFFGSRGSSRETSPSSSAATTATTTTADAATTADADRASAEMPSSAPSAS